MIELIQRHDGFWTWRWIEGEQSIWSSKSYSQASAAKQSATRAYPGAEVVVSGRGDSGEPEPSETSGLKKPSRRKRRRTTPEGGPPSRLVSLILLVLAYLRSRRAVDSRRPRR